MLPGISLILGGAASGKTAFAENLAASTGRGPVYLATAQITDEEMRAKIDRHRKSRGSGWRTLEEPMDAGRALAAIGGDNVVLMDCATMWLSNRMLAGHDCGEAEAELMAGLSLCAAPVVIVSNEVGNSIVPENALAREFREAQGRLNQKLAAKAGLVVQVVAGLPMVLKGHLP
ncbi:MAG: bifunctional adenosylcobinamide kinase/adenosylcobinamide-phosphate guanylyltransferase [Roseovarius sp.]|nr:bifunctional adenosylcobinamide kinase/adenosylcobinamide-phosphate guanylyltransferase [Roseovarius sp.]MCY4314757.1 bifunctional adenosylcobinamide kinase/adenosylcobinamide-phosphate guanylyltransferase [Roseovarius sp.]